MIEKYFSEVYQKFKIHFYKGIFDRLGDRDSSLSASEAFAVEVIYAMDKPTVGEFADCIGVSRPNATYKVNSLIKKGYLEKIPSDFDKREYHLILTKKFHDYYAINEEYILNVLDRIKERFTPEEQKQFANMLKVISRELMPEQSLGIEKK